MSKQKCVLCGEREASRKGEHLPPQSIYSKPRKPNMALHKVPACKECNNPAGKHDEEFKIIIGFLTGEYRDNQDSIVDSMAKTVGFNERLARQVFSKYQHGYAIRNHGVLEPVTKLQFKMDSYREVIKRIARGFYWRETNNILSKDAKINVHITYGMDLSTFNALKKLMDCLQPKKFNDDTFIYKAYIEGGESIFGFNFFKKHTVFVSVSEN